MNTYPTTPCVVLVAARYLKRFSVHLVFNTGEEGSVDLREVIFSSPAAVSLREPLEFSRFHLDTWPTLAWDCGFDLAPETLYALAIGKREPS